LIYDINPNSSVFEDPVIYGSYNFISDLSTSFKDESELKDDYFDPLQKAFKMVRNYKEEAQE
jgi:hypothetical protein